MSILGTPGQGLTAKLAYARIVPGNAHWIGTGFYIDDINKQKMLSKQLQIKLMRWESLLVSCTS
ncbi:MAG: hypothetical protein OCC45_02305 [Desulfotalea sp.]